MEGDGTLSIALSCSVPLFVERWRDQTWGDRQRRARECAQIIAEKGDVLQFGGKGCAVAFNALAEGLAIASFVPGGVRFAGEHWESK